MKRNLTFQVDIETIALVKIASKKVGAHSVSEYCRDALTKQLSRDGLLDNNNRPLMGVLPYENK